MSKSQRGSPRQKKKFGLFDHRSADNEYEAQQRSYKNNNGSMNYHNQPAHHQQPFHNKPNLSHHSSHHSQTFPQQHNNHNNHNYYNNHNHNHDLNGSHKSPYFSHHQAFRAPSPYSIDENQAIHNHSGHHQSRSAMPNLAQSQPNIHHTKRYSAEKHHNQPPKHHHRGFIAKNTSSNTPTQQLKQSSSTKSQIFNHYPPNNIQSPQHHPYNRHYVVNSPQQLPSKPYGNTYNLPPRGGRTRANTFTQQHVNRSSPIYKEEDMLEYPPTYSTERNRRQPQNHYHDGHQPQLSLSQLNAYNNNMMENRANTYKSTLSAISPTLPPNNMTSQHGGFNKFSIMNTSRSHHHIDEHPAYTNNNNTISTALSLDHHHFYNNANNNNNQYRNNHANSHNEWGPTPQDTHRRRVRYHSSPNASPNSSPKMHAQQNNIRHIKTDTLYHIYDNVFDRTPSSNSSHFSLDDDLRNLQEYHLANTPPVKTHREKSRTSNKSSSKSKEYYLANTPPQKSQMEKPRTSNKSNSRSRRRAKRRKDAYKEHKKKKKKKKKGRQAIWAHRKQETNKYFVKKSSHKKIIGSSFIYKKSDATKKFLKKRIQQELLFENLPSEMIRKMVKQMYRVDISPAQNVVRCGDAADAYFVIEKGVLEIWKHGNYQNTPKEEDHEAVAAHSSDSSENRAVEEQKPVLKDRLEAGDTFGDNALLYATTHQYTYRAQSSIINMMNANHEAIACRCWALSQETFDAIRKKQASSRLESSSRLIKFIKSIAMFSDLEAADLQEISDAMMRITYRKTDKIVCEGDSSTHFFIIYRGTCDATKKIDSSKILKSYSVGDCFGELGIMKNQSRAATVSVTSDQLVAYALPALDFKSLLDYDVVAKSMHKKINQYLAIPDDCKSFANKVNCALADFKEIGCLGVGAFGRVTLVEMPDDKCVYALKKVRKNRIVETSQQEHIINEKRIMTALDSEFCIRLFGTYKDKLNVYFLLEPVMGGELFSLLRHEKRLQQRTATFYCACVILAFDYLHTKLNVIYRDLKPENLLISRNGYCKLVDFGFAKKRNNTCTLCGTPQYLAPEVIQNFAHGFAVDWWSVGILIYEMIFGYPPFEGDKNMKMYEKILTAPVEFPQNPQIRSYTKDIINSLLRKQAHKRLGAGTKGADVIKKHPFFKKIDWKKMHKQQIDPPWKPRIKGTHDLSAFDRFPDTTPENEVLIDDPDNTLFKWCDEF